MSKNTSLEDLDKRLRRARKINENFEKRPVRITSYFDQKVPYSDSKEAFDEHVFIVSTLKEFIP